MNKKKTNLERILAHQKKSWMRSGPRLTTKGSLSRKKLFGDPRKHTSWLFCAVFCQVLGLQFISRNKMIKRK